MRSVLGILLACLFTAAIIADTVVCPDGCTDEGPIAAQHAASPCGLCQGCRQAVITVTAPPAAHRIARHATAVAAPAAPALPAIEQPPKHA